MSSTIFTLYLLLPLPPDKIQLFPYSIPEQTVGWFEGFGGLILGLLFWVFFLNTDKYSRSLFCKQIHNDKTSQFNDQLSTTLYQWGFKR